MNKSLFLSILLAAGLHAEPRRIVSLTPALTEIAFSLGLSGRVIGVSTYCHYPPEVLQLPKIGSYLRPNLEAILVLKPDLVLVEKNPLGITEKLTSLKLNIVEVDAKSLDSIPAAIEKIAQATGVSAKASIAQFEKSIAEVRAKVGNRKTKVMFVVGRTPGALDGLIVAGRGSYIDALLERGGGTNVFADSKSAYPKISLEEVIARQPDVIIDMGDMAQTVGVTEVQKKAVEGLWRQRPIIKARVVAVADDIFVVPGPRASDAIRAFARILHPGAGL